MCDYCTHLGSDGDGYEYNGSWPICHLDKPIQYLKGFPFKKPPKCCKKVFQINPWMMPSCVRYWNTQEYLCGWICKEGATKEWDKQSCRETNCDVFRYISGRTDMELSDTSIRQALIGKFPGFEMVEWDKCTECEGEGLKLTGKYGVICSKCNGKGYMIRGLEHGTLA